MKKIILTFVALCAFCAFIYAGGEPLPSTSKEVAPQPAVIEAASCFDGWYFGVRAGGMLENFDSHALAEVEAFLGDDDDDDDDDFFDSSEFDDDDDDDDDDDEFNFLAGLHIGRNFQRGGWIFGGEVDLSATDFEQSHFEFASIDPPGQSSLTAGVSSDINLPWVSTMRPRIGHTLGQRAHVFGTGGLAVALAEVSQVTALSGSLGGGPSGTINEPPFVDHNREVEFGWTAGGGVEFCVSEHVILSLMYLYTDLGSKSATTDLSNTSPNGDDEFFAFTRTRADLKFHSVQGGISLRY